MLDCDNKGKKYKHGFATWTPQTIAVEETKRGNSILIAFNFSGVHVEQVRGKWQKALQT